VVSLFICLVRRSSAEDSAFGQALFQTAECMTLKFFIGW